MKRNTGLFTKTERPFVCKWSFIRIVLTILLCLFAFSSLGKAIYLSAKAEVAQHLLKTAWAESLQYQTAVKPWPWADIHPAGLLTIPALDIEQVVVNEHSGEALAFGPGLVKSRDAFVIAGHRDSHFTFVKTLKIDDELDLQESNGIRHRYRIIDLTVLDTRQQTDIQPPPGSLVLITCYPFNAPTAGGPLRYMVYAEKIESVVAYNTDVRQHF